MYTATLTAENEVLDFDTGALGTILIEYNQAPFDPESIDRTLLACKEQPADAAFSNVDLMLPTDETACFYSVTVDQTWNDGTTQFGTETWEIVFKDDPNWSFK